MKKRLLIICILLTVIVFHAAAQDNEQKFSISGDLTTIYTIGNADETQKYPEPVAGAYGGDPNKPAKKNGFYTAVNLYANLHPFPWLDGYFKLYAINRPGSVYFPLHMENLDPKDFTTDMTFDSAYVRASVFKALDLDLPVDLFIRAGKFKSQASAFGVVSKYGTEQILYLMTIKNDFTYELGVTFDSPVNLTVFAAANYRLDEATQRYYDEDGMQDHGIPVPDKYAPQIFAGLKMQNFDFGTGDLSAEILYGNNVSNIYSGNAIGFSALYALDINENIRVPIGILAAYYEKNIDLLANAAVVPEKGDNTMNFRDTISVGLGTGLRLTADIIDLDFNLAGTYNSIKHYYRNDLSIIKFSADMLFTVNKNYFIGGGIIAGSLTDANWKTRDDADPTKDAYDHTFTLAENMGYEVYAGINLAGAGRFVIGFNQNKGISLNNMLEAKVEGQMKYKQLDTEWKDRLIEAGGLYFKFTVKY
jgi:hypothetical protein